jgi:hypothetical protein
VSGQVQDMVAWNLEGLVLRDGSGRLYEVPRVVIERYRMEVERAAELMGTTAAEASARWLGVLRPAAWTVDGGIYVAGSAAAAMTAEQRGLATDHTVEPGIEG